MLGSARFLTTELTAYDSLAAADVVVSDASMVAIEAAIAGKPLVQVDLPIAPLRFNRLGEYGVAVMATALDAVGPSIMLALQMSADPKNFQRFSKQYNFGGDGKASFRCARYLAKAGVKGTDAVTALELMEQGLGQR